MIIKVNHLTNFGNYRQFQWGNNTPFTKRNLIYGWNYSGKTTLSRLFQILENPSKLSQSQGCQFEVEVKGGTTFTQTNLTNPPRIKVFNRDFIQSNFQQEHKAPAVFIVGGKTIQLRNRISRLSEHQTKINTHKVNLENRRNLLKKEIDLLATNDASALATLTGDKTYNRTKLFTDIEKIKSASDSFIMSEENIQAKVALLRSTQEWKNIEPVFNVAINLEFLCKKLSVVLQKTATNDAIEKLKSNRELETWIRTGLSHHTDSALCEFCGSIISSNRLIALQKHFSKAYEDLTTEVATQVYTLEKSEISLTLTDERDFMPDLKNQFNALEAQKAEWINWANSFIDELKKLAKQKQLAVETQFTCLVDRSRIEEIKEIVAGINLLISTHNDKLSQLDKEKKSAKDAIEKHNSACFYQKNKVEERNSAIGEIENMIRRAEALLLYIENKKRPKELQIQEQSVAAQKLNKTIQYLMPDNNIAVAEIPGGFFEFRRDGLPANNLSEGEKTAITFSYFLATLESNGALLNQTIVFIDDPISSLDLNHIYSIYALIVKQLESCLQLFISTHSSELYTLLKSDWFVSRDKFANHKDASSYYTRRVLDNSNQQWHSTIEDTPNLLRKYNSEYQFIFDQLHKFAFSKSASLHEAYTSPNLLRKFLEAYLGFQKPCVTKWSKKLDLLFDNENERTEIQKFSDDASHLQSLNRAIHHPYFTNNAQNTVKKVIQALKAKDHQHYTSMCTVIGVTP